MNALKAALLYGANDVRVEEIPIPDIGYQEILVEMKACGVCGTDIEKMRGKFVTPPKLGHEVVGTVIKAGIDVGDIEIGDRVFIHHHVPCYKCYYCRHGDFTMCKNFPETNLDPCGFSEYVRVPRSNLEVGAVLKLPEKVNFELGTLIEPIACCIRGLNKIGFEVGEDVLVIGAGPVGLIMVSLLRQTYGAHNIITSEMMNFRMKTAKNFGANYVVNPRKENLNEKVRGVTEGRGADLVVVAVGSSEAIAQGMDCVRKGGRILLFGSPPKGDVLSYDASRIFINEIRIIPSYSTTEIETNTALKLLEKNSLEFRKLVTHRFPLSEAYKAIKFADESEEALKVLVTP